jgi:hypothetical protein
MTLKSYNFLLTLLYLLFPFITIVFFGLDSVRNYQMDYEVLKIISTSQLVSFFILNLAIFYFSKNLNQYLLEDIDEPIKCSNFFIALSYLSLFIFIIEIIYLSLNLRFQGGRDEKFLYLNSNINYLFLTFFNLCIFFSSFYNFYKNKHRFFYTSIFVFFLGLFSIFGEARLFLVVALAPIIISARFGLVKSVFLFSLVFILRVLITPSYKYDGTSQWFTGFLFGDVYNRLIGPMVILKDQPSLDFSNICGIFFNTIPFLSYFNKFFTDVAPVDVQINTLVKNTLGFDGVASTPYNDFLYSPINFILAVILCLMFFLISFKYARRYRGISFALYTACNTSLIVLYHVGFISFVNIFYRNFILYIFLFSLASPLIKRKATLKFKN